MDTSPTKIIKIAQNELGYLEKKSNSHLYEKTANAGDKNWTKYWQDIYPSYQQSAWCGCFVIWCFVKAFGQAEAKKLLCTTGAWSFYTPTEAQYFKDKNQWFISNPKIGDIIFFKNSERIHHTGVVYKTDSQKVYTIEGNTSSANEVVPNGGGVFAKSYMLNNTKIAGYGRPNYSEEANPVDILVTCGRAGLKIVGASSLNIRETPINGTVVGSYKLGALVQVTAKAKASDGTYWFKTDKGYISGNYVEGWLKEQATGTRSRWWYIKLGYTFPKLTIELIDNKYYGFDKDGWLIEASDINTDGSIK